MAGTISAIKAALPRISAATAIDVVDIGSKCDPLAIRTRIKATRWSATKKKIVGGRIAKNSSLSFVNSLDIALNCERVRRRQVPKPHRARKLLAMGFLRLATLNEPTWEPALPREADVAVPAPSTCLARERRQIS